MEWARKQGYHQNQLYIEFDAPKRDKNEIVTLTEEELLRLLRLDLSSTPHLERVRDLFCFGCFTGQRWSDFSSFDKIDLEKKGPIYVWKFISKKTGKEITLPFEGFTRPALEILEKYDFSKVWTSGRI